MSELARRALISRSGMTRRAGQLEERGLVARQPDPADRRSVVLTLTDEGAGASGAYRFTSAACTRTSWTASPTTSSPSSGTCCRRS